MPVVKSARIFAWSLFAGMLLLGSAAADTAPFAIVEPRDMSLVDGTFISISLKLSDPAIDSVTISGGNKNDEAVVQVAKGSGVVCKTYPLRINRNELTVTALKDGNQLASQKVTVFNFSDISKQYKTSPPEFAPAMFHTKEREAVCAGCHALNAGEKDLRPGKSSNSMCYACHRKITEFKYIHGPAAKWECLACHEKDSSPVKYEVRKTERELCFACHDEERAKWAEKEYMHGPTATGKCSICHNPHASANRYWLKLPPAQLCASCHEDMGTGKKRHNLRLFNLIGDHPIKGFRDPRDLKERLTCTSCHTPHASFFPMMLAFEGKSIFAFCNQCHMK